MKLFLVACGIALALFVVTCREGADTDPQSDLLFPKVKSIIEANCVVCHQPGGLGMPLFLTADTTIVNLAESIKSVTIDPASPRNKRMPLGGELSDADKQIIIDWVAKGGLATD